MGIATPMPLGLYLFFRWKGERKRNDRGPRFLGDLLFILCDAWGIKDEVAALKGEPNAGEARIMGSSGLIFWKRCCGRNVEN